MKNIIKNLLDKASGKEEKKIDILSSIVERNKIKNSGASIDEVVAFAKSRNIKHDLYI